MGLTKSGKDAHDAPVIQDSVSEFLDRVESLARNHLYGQVTLTATVRNGDVFEIEISQSKTWRK